MWQVPIVRLNLSQQLWGLLHDTNCRILQVANVWCSQTDNIRQVHRYWSQSNERLFFSMLILTKIHFIVGHFDQNLIYFVYKSTQKLSLQFLCVTLETGGTESLRVLRNEARRVGGGQPGGCCAGGSAGESGRSMWSQHL